MICRVIGETSRWLFVNGKEKEAMDNIRLVAKWNRVDLPENLKVIVKVCEETFTTYFVLHCDSISFIRPDN